MKRRKRYQKSSNAHLKDFPFYHSQRIDAHLREISVDTEIRYNSKHEKNRNITNEINETQNDVDFVIYSICRVIRVARDGRLQKE